VVAVTKIHQHFRYATRSLVCYLPPASSIKTPHSPAPCIELQQDRLLSIFFCLLHIPHTVALIEGRILGFYIYRNNNLHPDIWKHPYETGSELLLQTIWAAPHTNLNITAIQVGRMLHTRIRAIMDQAHPAQGRPIQGPIPP
jgi:hypothetical protein